MATGRVATTQLNSGNIATMVSAYTIPTGYYGIYNVSFTNTTASAVTIRLAVSATGTPGASEYYEYGTTIIPNGVFERTGLAIQAGYQIQCSASASGVNVNVYGIETSTS